MEIPQDLRRTIRLGHSSIQSRHTPSNGKVVQALGTFVPSTRRGPGAAPVRVSRLRPLPPIVTRPPDEGFEEFTDMPMPSKSAEPSMPCRVEAAGRTAVCNSGGLRRQVLFDEEDAVRASLPNIDLRAQLRRHGLCDGRGTCGWLFRSRYHAGNPSTMSYECSTAADIKLALSLPPSLTPSLPSLPLSQPPSHPSLVQLNTITLHLFNS